ncbi:MAG: DUF3570 domain-containing protein [Methylococcaceae bacterium]|nr:DUF3570 domain-containing protein [Methylococcaceae bacterium]
MIQYQLNKNKPAKPSQSVLTTLSTAALVLPGLLPAITYATEDDSVDFQYSHYQEGKRDLNLVADYYDNLSNAYLITPVNNYRNPIEVDSIHGSGRFSLTDRIKFAFNYTEDTWSGATPLATMPNHTLRIKNIGLDKNGEPLLVTGATPLTNFIDGNGQPYYALYDQVTGQPTYNKDVGIVHAMSYASPETRKQGDFKLSYEWDEAALDVGGGISTERDYESRFVNLGGRMDFNQKQTSVNLGLSYTNSAIEAAVHFGGVDVLEDRRQDWATHLGLTQVINPDALFELGMGYTRSTGYLSNPYKASLMYYKLLPNEFTPFPDGLTQIKGFLSSEQRPDKRNQFNWDARWAQYIEPLDAALHLEYQFSHDDWDINAHTFAADWVQPLGEGWSVTPRIRYYSQDAADFYGTMFGVDATATLDPNGYYNYEIGELPTHFSSDHRLSGYGTLSGGLTVAKEFAKGIRLETGIEYYTHQGSLKLGGGGEESYADFDFWVANAALKVNFSALSQSSSGGDLDHTNHDGHTAIPAGVLFGHTLDNAGDMMVGYRLMHSQQAGGFLKGDNSVSEKEIITKGCPGAARYDEQGNLIINANCSMLPREMVMNMHMLDIMYAPTDWLTLMLMPQFLDMKMPMYQPESIIGAGHSHGGDGQTSHESLTGGIGDTGLYALIKLFDTPHQHLHATLGFSAPTGDTGIKIKDYAGTFASRYNLDGAYTHYGMQLGSGTWDFKPSITYTGKVNDWSWGAQLGGTLRMEHSNSSGYALGDLFETSLWGAYDLTPWLSISVRAAYTWQGSIKNQYTPGRNDYLAGECKKSDFNYQDETPTDEEGNPIGPNYFHSDEYNRCLIDVANYKRFLAAQDRPSSMDAPSNYGGQYVDVGFGLSATVPTGAFAGNRLAFEWLQPVYTNVNGYQLDRDGALSFTWSYGF